MPQTPHHVFPSDLSPDLLFLHERRSIRDTICTVIPERISHYTILKKLGSGGMGEVYLAEDANLGRTVAIKILPSDVASDPTRHRRFVQEAKAASALKHPGVAGIYELGEWDGMHFIVMEHVEGETLEERIKGQPLAIPQILHFAVQITDALEEAHSRGVIHRDIKPPNIMITQKDQVKILDFGLAKMLMANAGQQSDFSKLGTQSGTEPGLVLGTVQYMSPEQALGKPIDHRSDLFSFGIVLYQMTTGRLPFAAASTTETINRIVNSAPEAIARYNYSCPPELEHIIRKCIEKDPERRYQSAQDLLIDLKNLKRDTESGATQARSSAPLASKPRHRVLLAIAGVLLIAGVAVFFLLRRTEDPAKETLQQEQTKTRTRIAVLPFQNLGAADDQYFAEGMTDEITSRLASVEDLGVISRSSAMQYQKTTKGTKQIGQELGADYLLAGTIRWSRSGATNRVRVTPQLIRVTDDTQVWSNIYDHVIDDVFQVQSDVAQGVIQQLGITLGESKQKELSEAPTTNLEAYQYYLHGNEDYYAPSYDPDNMKLAIQNYQRATELDPSFALAYAHLAIAHLQYFHEGVDPSPKRLALAKAAVDKALQLKPDLPKAQEALGMYHYHGFRDYEKALKAFAIAVKAAPNNADALSAIAFVERRQGKFEESVEHLKRVFELDPRRPILPMEMGSILTRLRRYAEAESYYDRALQLAPEQVYGYGLKSQNSILWKGDLQVARRVLEKMPSREPNTFYLNWINHEITGRNFQSALNLLDKTSVEAFQEEGVYMPKSLFRALILYYSNQQTKAGPHFETARNLLEKAVPERPKDAAVHQSLGLAYAGLGRKEDAIREGKLAVQMLPISKDSLMGIGPIQTLAEIYTMTGEKDLALDQLEHLLSIPSWTSVRSLELEPVWDPLRNHPRYQQMIQKFARQ